MPTKKTPAPRTAKHKPSMDQLPYTVFQVYDALLKRMAKTCSWAAFAIDYHLSGKNIGDDRIKLESVSSRLREATEGLADGTTQTTAELLISIAQDAKVIISEPGIYHPDRVKWANQWIRKDLERYEAIINRKSPFDRSEAEDDHAPLD